MSKVSLILRRHDLFIIAVLLFFAAVFGMRPGSAARELHANTVEHLESIELAEHLAMGEGFASPFHMLETGRSVHVAPGFPFLVSLIFRYWGDGLIGLSILCWLTAAVLAIQLALLPYLSLRMGLPPMAGLVAALMLLVQVRGLARPKWEVNYVGLILVLLALYSIGSSETAINRWRIVGIAILWGVLFLFSPVALIAFPAWLIWLRYYRRVSTHDLMVLVIILLLMVAPWVIRNYFAFHKLVFIRGNLGLELATANNSCASYDLPTNLLSGCYAANHPNQGLQQARRVLALGEVEYNRQRLYEFLHWLRNHPRRFATLSLERCAAFWFPWDRGDTIKTLTFDQVMTWTMTIVGFLGIWQLWKTNRAVSTYLLVWLALFPVSYYFAVAFEDRHRIPILWATFVPGCYCILNMLGGDWDSFLNPDKSPSRPADLNVGLGSPEPAGNRQGHPGTKARCPTR